MELGGKASRGTGVGKMGWQQGPKDCSLQWEAGLSLQWKMVLRVVVGTGQARRLLADRDKRAGPRALP